MAASAAMHQGQAACWMQFPWEHGDKPSGRSWAEQRGCPVGHLAARKTLAWEILSWCTSFLHTWPSCTASPRGAKLKSMRRAGISFSATLIWLHWENGLIPILHHCVFQHKERNCGLCPWYESPLGCTVPRSKKMKQKLNLAGNPN